MLTRTSSLLSSASRKRLLSNLQRSSFSSLASSSTKNNKIVDLRSDTLTAPSEPMLQSMLTAQTGDDVFGEDPTVIELQNYMANLFGKEAGLFTPTGTMGNLCGILAHCSNEISSEIIIGSNSHICIYEGGNVSNLGGISTKQIQETENNTLCTDAIQDCFYQDIDDHYPKTQLLCLENTHNVLGGVVIPPDYLNNKIPLLKQNLKDKHDNSIKVHVDGARIMNASISTQISPSELNKNVDSVSICLSKGLGCPVGSVLVATDEIIYKAKRIRKRCGGGMRQAGLLAKMGLYAMENNVERLSDDHKRAKRLAEALSQNGFYLPRDGVIDTNIVFFGLPEPSDDESGKHKTALVKKEELCDKLLAEHGIKIGGGYSKGGRLFRAVTHLDVNDEDVDRAAEALVKVSFG